MGAFLVIVQLCQWFVCSSNPGCSAAAAGDICSGESDYTVFIETGVNCHNTKQSIQLSNITSWWYHRTLSLPHWCLTDNIYFAYQHIYILCQYTCHCPVTPALHAATSEWGRHSACYHHSISAFLLCNISVDHDKMWFFLYSAILWSKMSVIFQNQYFRYTLSRGGEPACARWRYASGGTGEWARTLCLVRGNNISSNCRQTAR